MNEKLFAILLGGKHQDAILELHDIRFTFAQDRKAAFQKMAGQWFGLAATAHVDAWVNLTEVDGHVLCEAIDADPKLQLYFLNLGSYQKGVFHEDHRYLFLIGRSLSEVKAKAKRNLGSAQLKPHFDNAELVDLILPIVEVDAKKLHWKKAQNPTVLTIENGYWPIKNFVK